MLNRPKRSSFRSLLLNFYFGLSFHIMFQHGSSLSLENDLVRRPLCHKVNLPSFVAWRPLCHKVNLLSCEAQRRHLITTQTCDIFGTGQTNPLTLCYLLGKTYKPTHSITTLESLKSTCSTNSIEGFEVSAKFEFRCESF